MFILIIYLSEFERNYKNDFDHQISNNINNNYFLMVIKEKMVHQELEIILV